MMRIGEIKINNGIVLLMVIFISAVSNTDAETFKTGPYPGDSFVDPAAVIDVGSFSIGSESYIAPFTSFTGESANIGSYSDVQDSGTDSGRIKINDNAVVAHGADLTGDIEVGSKAFIGFNSVIKDTKIGDGAYIGIRSTIVGVDIPAGKYVPEGSIIKSKEDIVNLKPVTKAQQDFVNEVIEVNRALAIGYGQLYEKQGESAFGKAGPSGNGDIIINGKDILEYKGSYEPTIGQGTEIGNSRVIGYVILGNNIQIENGTSIRGDEGVPIKIGNDARIGKNNTFHSLNGKKVIIGNNFKLGSETVVHGPVVIGDNVQAGNRVVLFKSNIGDNVMVGENAVVIGVRLIDGAVIPPNTILLKQRDANLFNYATQKYKDSTTPAPIFQLAIASLIPIGFGLIGSMFLGKK